MSHFTVLVITKQTSQNTKDVFQNEIEKMLEPYSENLEVDEYDKQCYCVGTIARNEIWNQSIDKFGSWDALRAKFHDGISPKPFKPLGEMTDEEQRIYDDSQDKAWKEFGKEKKQFEHDAFEQHPLKDKPEIGCSDCNGTGLYKSTYNPKSKWDWYSIGGRWSGELHEDGLNIFPAKELKTTTFAVVTPDGEWHERGKMCWFAIVADEDDNWDNLCRELVNQYGDNYAVVVDCHI